MAQWDYNKFPQYFICGWEYTHDEIVEHRFNYMKFHDFDEAVKAYESMNVEGDINQIELVKCPNRVDSEIIRAKDAHGEIEINDDEEGCEMDEYCDI